MPIWDIFKKREEPVEKTVDPIVEQRRKEKFSTPFIYGNEENKVEKTNTITTNTTATSTTSANKKIVKPKSEIGTTSSGYRMSEIISPFYGRKEEPVAPKSKQTTPKKTQRRKSIEDQIVPVISPFYGAGNFYDDYEEEEEIIVPTAKAAATIKEEEIKKDTASFNLNDILKQENDNLKIVEKRTGEIQLDILNATTSTKNKKMDEIEDAMTLDELMSLYERKFKDGDNE